MPCFIKAVILPSLEAYRGPSRQQESPQGHLKEHGGAHPRAPDSVGLRWVREPAPLISSQAILLLLLRGPHLRPWTRGWVPSVVAEAAVGRWEGDPGAGRFLSVEPGDSS